MQACGIALFGYYQSAVEVASFLRAGDYRLVIIDDNPGKLLFKCGRCPGRSVSNRPTRFATTTDRLSTQLLSPLVQDQISFPVIRFQFASTVRLYVALVVPPPSGYSPTAWITIPSSVPTNA